MAETSVSSGNSKGQSLMMSAPGAAVQTRLQAPCTVRLLLYLQLLLLTCPR
jgi:hypothetical protein